MEKEREFSFTDTDFNFLAKLVNQHTGIVLADHKRNMVYSRLARRLRQLKMTSFAEYCDFLSSDTSDSEMMDFVNAITTNLTGFYRESHHFDHLKGVLQDIQKAGKSKRIRIWSSACSSGQEPYSIAMTMTDALSNIASWDAKILATDLDTNMVATAQKGEYSDTVLEKIPPHYHKRFTNRVGGKDSGMIVMPDNIKGLITFKQLNLLHNWPFKGPFDVVFCRNVVIYFDKPTQKILFDRIANILKPDGFLYIGHSESLFKVSERFKLIGKTIYQRIE